jgi:hypothetical protein
MSKMVSGSDASSSLVSKAEVTSKALAADHPASGVSKQYISRARRNEATAGHTLQEM